MSEDKKGISKISVGGILIDINRSMFCEGLPLRKDFQLNSCRFSTENLSHRKIRKTAIVKPHEAENQCDRLGLLPLFLLESFRWLYLA